MNNPGKNHRIAYDISELCPKTRIKLVFDRVFAEKKQNLSLDGPFALK